MKVPQTPPSLADLIMELASGEPETLVELLNSRVDPPPGADYVHWDDLRYRPPPAGFTHRQWWLALKLARRGAHRLPFVDTRHRGFVYSLPDELLKLIHEIDRGAGGRVELAELVANSPARDRHRVSSLIEESITSSQLEGAATTHEVAKEMLRQGRKPRNQGEQMIHNNYAAMQFIRDQGHRPLSAELILQLQSVMTGSKLHDASASGRWRHADENVRVVDERSREVLYLPPPAGQIADRMTELCRFANDCNESPFVHPLIKAMVIHFMVGWIHPFVDGNGRTARALFYWSMAKSNYGLIEFTSISRVIKQAPAQYARAYLHTETDDNDLTYFFAHQLKVISASLQSLRLYLAKQTRQLADTGRLIAASPTWQRKLNHRQLAAMESVIKNPHRVYRIEEHRNANRITYETARTDLLSLVDFGLLEKQLEGKAFVFRIPRGVREELAAYAGAQSVADPLPA